MTIDDVLNQVDAATNAIAARIQTLVTELQNAGTLTQAQQDRFNTEIAALQALGTSTPPETPAA